MRPDTVLGPDARHSHVRYAATEFGRELARRPVGRTVSGGVPGRTRKHACLKAIGHLVAFASGVPREEARQTICGKTLAPTIDVAVTAIKFGPDLCPGQSLSKQQDEARVSRRLCPNGPPTGSPLQFNDFGFGQFHHALHEHNDTSHLSVTVH
jgi:hypothetical protein